MNKARVVGLVAVSVLLVAVSAHAAAGLGPKARIFAKFDTNQNGVIDGDEVAAVRAAYAADPKGELARYDADKDGKLSDAEIAAIKPPGGRKSGAQGHGGQRKGGGGKDTTSQPSGD